MNVNEYRQPESVGKALIRSYDEELWNKWNLDPLRGAVGASPNVVAAFDLIGWADNHRIEFDAAGGSAYALWDGFFLERQVHSLLDGLNVT